MDVTGISNQVSGRSTEATGSIGPGGQLGEDAFLKLLVAQLQNQDPLSPMKDQDFIAQMAQFRILEQLDRLNELMAYQAGVQGLMQASGLLGKEVTAQPGKDAQPITGVVTRVSLRDGEPVLTVNGQDVYLADVVQVGRSTGSGT